MRVLLAVLLAAACPVFAQKSSIYAGWVQITDAERGLKAPIVEPEAGAEAIFWQVHVTDELNGGDLRRIFNHYVRLKVFTREGAEKNGTIDISYGPKTSIVDIAGRTIRADGTIAELKKEAVHEQEVLRFGKLRLHKKSFAMPGVEPGAIVEYRWREVRDNSALRYLRLEFQRELPVQRVIYLLKPLSLEFMRLQMSMRPFHCKPSPFVMDREGYSVTTLERVPAYREEPMMPSEPNVRPWALIFYHDGSDRQSDKYWREVGKSTYQELKGVLKATDELKREASAAVAGAQGEERVRKLIGYIRSNFRSLSDSSVTEEERRTVLKQMSKEGMRSGSDIFKSKIGTGSELNALFAVLAQQSGLEVRPALIASRNEVLFEKSFNDHYFLRDIDMAVKLGDEWRIVDVSARNLPSHMLAWPEEGMPALLSDPKEPQFIMSGNSSPDQSGVVRIARLQLNADGSIEGEIEESHTGHKAAEEREEYRGETPAKLQEMLTDSLRKRFVDAEVSKIRVENLDDPDLPVSVKYAIRIPQYAQLTGKRILFHPLYFQRGAPPLFSASQRVHDIHFPYAWTDTDKLVIKLPPGFFLDSPENPGSLDLKPVGSYSLNLSLRNNIDLIVERKFVWGGDGRILFRKENYAQLKQVFDEVHRRDTHMLSLRQAANRESGK